jgi:enoyl-CoA hydratase/carnithine racemase
MDHLSPAVRFEIVEPHIALVTLDRPEARNAVNGDVARGLEAAVERVEQDDELRVAVLTGAGPVFCAGADLKEVSAGRGAALATERGGFAGFVRTARTKLWIAAAQGHALAGGLELLLSCDLAVVAETATFGLPEVKRSLVAGAGGVFRLPRALPRAIALEIIATGDPITAARAGQFGLVNQVVPAEQVREAAR